MDMNSYITLLKVLIKNTRKLKERDLLRQVLTSSIRDRRQEKKRLRRSVRAARRSWLQRLMPRIKWANLNDLRIAPLVRADYEAGYCGQELRENYLRRYWRQQPHPQNPGVSSTTRTNHV